MTKFKEWENHEIDVLVGGTPCQSFSVAGLRKGLDDPRGNLMLTYLAIADQYRPKWLVWENVPGVLSSNDGKDFGAFLGGLAELGYGFAYRVLDAQHFGVPQRRRRVFVVGCLGDWRSAAAVLFERHSLQGHPAPRRQKGKDIAGTLTGGASMGGMGPSGRTDMQIQGYLQVAASTGEISHCLNAGGMGRQDYETETLITHTLRGEGFDASEDGTGRGTPLVPVAFDTYNQTTDDTAQTLCSRGDSPGGSTHLVPAIMSSMQVRRLTPPECEALQGFKRNYTLVPHRGKPAADGPRYKALGNSIAIPCMSWLGMRIQMVETMTTQTAVAA